MSYIEKINDLLAKGNLEGYLSVPTLEVVALVNERDLLQAKLRDLEDIVLDLEGELHASKVENTGLRRKITELGRGKVDKIENARDKGADDISLGDAPMGTRQWMDLLELPEEERIPFLRDIASHFNWLLPDDCSLNV